MVADPLEIADGVQQGGDDVGVLVRQLKTGYLDKEGAELILIVVERLLKLGYPVGGFAVISAEQFY